MVVEGVAGVCECDESEPHAAIASVASRESRRRRIGLHVTERFLATTAVKTTAVVKIL
jgi:hypothetical protein